MLAANTDAELSLREKDSSLELITYFAHLCVDKCRETGMLSLCSENGTLQEHACLWGNFAEILTHFFPGMEEYKKKYAWRELVIICMQAKQISTARLDK